MAGWSPSSSRIQISVVNGIVTTPTTAACTAVEVALATSSLVASGTQSALPPDELPPSPSSIGAPPVSEVEPRRKGLTPGVGEPREDWPVLGNGHNAS